MPEKMEATFSMLTMSIASSAAMSLGLVPNQQTNKTEVDKNMAKFNIDLLIMLKEKTKNNLSSDESKFLDSIISDLQLKFVEINK